MLDQQTIEQQQELLVAHRRRLAYRLRQQARLGDYTPPEVALDIEDARAAIGTLKAGLRAGGAAVADDPIDVADTAPQPALRTSQEQRNRSSMLARVRDWWIRGVLEQSLTDGARLALGLELRPAAVASAWDAIVQREAPARLLPPGTPIAQVFDDLSGELLILGAPGAGKTTLLLELARDLLDRALQDPGHPIPVVFNLAPWATQRRPIADWLVDELNERYDVPRAIGQAWVAQDQLLLLLDGLDEVPPGDRAACVAAINAFRRDHGLVDLAVCSRIADYEALDLRLRLAGAVLVQPLAPAQIEAYLAGMGERGAALRAALQNDPALRELAQLPLMLNIMALVYQGGTPGAAADVLPAGTDADRRAQLFAAYVDHMFERRGVDTRYTREQTIAWLAWLARTLARRSQTVFLIERLQPDWLPSRAARRRYVLLDRLGGGLVLGLAVGLISGMLSGLGGGLTGPLTSGLADGFKIGLVAGLFGGASGAVSQVLQEVRRLARSAILGYLVVGLGVGLVSGLAGLSGAGVGPGNGLIDSLDRTPIGAQVAGLAGILGGGLLLAIGGWLDGGPVGALAGGVAGGPGVSARRIAVVETLRWSWAKAGRAALGGAIGGLPAGLAGGLAGLLVGWSLLGGLGGALVLGLVGALFTALAGAMVFGLVFGMAGGLSGGEVEAKIAPNQGIWRSGRSALLSGLIIGGVFGLGNELIYGPLFGMAAQLAPSLIFGVIFGLIGALAYGGFACLSHLALRVVLWQSGALPWNCARFLDYAATRIFVRKVGGGYMFVHRLLHEYFASLV